MTRHYRKYADHFGYMPGEAMTCELTGYVSRHNNLHHIVARQMGGNPLGDRDEVVNVMCIRTDLHDMYGDKKQYMDFLKEAHRLFMEDRLPWVERGHELPGFPEKQKRVNL